MFSLTQGLFRHYLFPVYTPAGFAVTSESPADHPHHNSFWIASDHILCWMPVAGGAVEEYTYNIYLDEAFQGRAAGRIVGCKADGASVGPDSFSIRQELEWRGPVEWAAPNGRLLMTEERTFEISADTEVYTIDLTSRITATKWDLTLGPTRHAYFSFRVAESIAVTSGGTVQSDAGDTGGDLITANGAHWVDYSGPVGGGNIAGLSVCPHRADHEDLAWFVSDWGVVTTGPFRRQKRDLKKGETLQLRYRVLVHDGHAEKAGVADRFATYLAAAR